MLDILEMIIFMFAIVLLIFPIIFGLIPPP